MADGLVLARKETREPGCRRLSRDVENVAYCRPDLIACVALLSPARCYCPFRAQEVIVGVAPGSPSKNLAVQNSCEDVTRVV